MNKGSGSKTAIGAAILRAAHQLLDGPQKILYDPVIVQLIGEQGAGYINTHKADFTQPESLALRSHIVLRSRYTEDCLQEAVEQGIRQYILLGAGLDTFAYRQPPWSGELAIYEADHPDSQAEKLQLLQQFNIAVPDNLSFIKMNLEEDDWQVVFSNSSISLARPVFISCLGVLIYLRKTTVDKIFQFAGKLPRGSIFIFTASQRTTYSVTSSAAIKAGIAGEPWITWFTPAALEEQLLACGFSQVIFLTPAEATALYYNNSHLPPPRLGSIVKAIV